MMRRTRRRRMRISVRVYIYREREREFIFKELVYLAKLGFLSTLNGYPKGELSGKVVTDDRAARAVITAAASV